MSGGCETACARKVVACMHASKYLDFIFRWFGLYQHRREEINWKNWIPMSEGRAMTRARKQFRLNCLRARVIARPRHWNSIFSTDLVYPKLLQTKSLENQIPEIFWSVHARNNLMCTGSSIAPWHCNSFFSTDLVYPKLVQTKSLEN